MPAAEVQTITRAACMEVAQECSPSGLPQEPGACEPGLGYTTIAKGMRLFRRGHVADSSPAPQQTGPRRNWIVDALRRNVETHPHWPVYRYLDAQGNVADCITCYGAFATAQSVARFLTTTCGLKPGDRVVLVYPPGLEFVKAMWGCLFADIVAVPVCPPDPTRLGATLPHFSRIVADSGAVAILTDRSFLMVKQATKMSGMFRSMVGGKAPQWPSIPWHVTDGAAALPPDHAKYAAGEHTKLGMRRMEAFMPTDPPEDPDRVAYLQYTSGSTGEPKGVMVTHGNLYAHNESGWKVFFRAEGGEAAAIKGISGTHMLLWLPHFHDFCLTVGILGCGMKGYPIVLMSPLHFIARPTRWLDFMARHRTSHTVGPDFAFGLLTRKTTPEQRRRWDLSNLQFIMSGAEPIRAETMGAFFGAFAVSGLKASVFCSAYGLAEHVCGATTWGTNQLTVDRRLLEAAGRARPAAQPADARVLVSCGAPMAGVELRVVHPEAHTVLEEGRVGEVWLSSACVTAGYFNRPAVNAEVFQARLAGAEAGGCQRAYLRTGDMGFLWRGELYVTGRLKDMMILRGRNIYPNDIEDCLRCAGHDLIRPGGLAAFPVDVTAVADGMAVEEEGLTIVVEVARGARPSAAQAEELAAFVRATVMAHHAVGCHAVVIAKAGAIKKTTSGKVQRRACRAAFMAGEYAQTNSLVLLCSFAAALQPANGAQPANGVHATNGAQPVNGVQPAANGSGGQNRQRRSGELSRRNTGRTDSPMRASDSDQSSNSVISMSDSASESASDGGRECFLASASHSTSDQDADLAPAASAHLLAEQLLALPEEEQLGVLQSYMVTSASEAAGIPNLDPDQPLLELGLDSLRAAEFAVQIEEHLGLAVPFTVVFEYPTIRQLAAHILYLLNTPSAAPIGVAAEDESETGPTLGALAEAAARAEGAGAAREADDSTAAGGGESVLLSAAAKAGGVPCAPAQMHFVTLQLMDPACTDQNVPGALRLRGQLDAGALAGALRAVSARHDALRTSIVPQRQRQCSTTGGGQPVQALQVVAPPDQALVALVAEDAAALPAGRFVPHCSIPEEVAEELPLPVLARIQSEAATPFDLARGPLVRARLIRLAAEDHLLLLTMHHAVADGWSVKVLLDDMSEAYNALRAGRPPVLPLVRLQYPDFAAWQIRHLASPAVQRQIDYWRDQLAGAPVLALPMDRPRGACSGDAGSAGVSGGWLAIELPQETVVALEGFAARCGATLFMVLLAALQLLLGALCGQDDVVVASPFAGRVHPATRGMVGCCINTLPLRTRLKGVATAGELMAQVRATALAAYTNAEAPLHAVMQALNRTQHEPLFQVELNLLEAEAQFGVNMDGLEVSSFELSPGNAGHLYWVMGHAGQRIAGRLEYNSALISAPRAARIAADWQAILKGMAESGKEACLAELRSRVCAEGGPGTPIKDKHEE